MRDVSLHFGGTKAKGGKHDGLEAAPPDDVIEEIDAQELNRVFVKRQLTPPPKGALSRSHKFSLCPKLGRHMSCSQCLHSSIVTARLSFNQAIKAILFALRTAFILNHLSCASLLASILQYQRTGMEV